MAKNARGRTAAAFPDNKSKDDALDFIDPLREVWSEVSQALNKTALFMLVLAATFELLTSSHAEGFALGPFSFADTSVIQKTLTVVVAYLNLETFVLAGRYSQCRDVHTQLMRIIYPKVEENDLDYYLAPPSRLIFPMGAGIRSENMSRSDAVLNSLVTFAGVCALFLPLVFEGHAFYELFNSYGPTDAFVWVCLILTVALLVSSWVLMATWIVEYS